MMTMIIISISSSNNNINIITIIITIILDCWLVLYSGDVGGCLELLERSERLALFDALNSWKSIILGCLGML